MSGNARSEVSQTRVQLTQLQAELDTNEMQRSELQAQGQEIARQRDVAQERLADCETDNTQLSGELELQRDEYQTLQKRMADLDAAFLERGRVL